MQMILRMVFVVLGAILIVQPAAAVSLPDVEMVQNTPEAEQVCGLVFDARNIEWRGVSMYRGDRIAISLPDSVTQPAWADQGSRAKAMFDFRNSGKEEAIYRIGLSSQFTGCCANEAEIYIAADKADAKFFGELPLEDGEIDVEKELWAEVWKQKANRNLTPIKLFGRGSPLYFVSWFVQTDDDFAVDPEVFLYGGKTYILSRRDLAIWKPNPKGTFDEVCRHKPLESHIEDRTELTQSGYPCPDRKKLPKPYSGDALDLAEWGGRRPVRTGCAMVSRIQCNPWALVGALGAATVDRKGADVWEPLTRALDEAEGDDANVQLYLTDEGPYMEITEGNFSSDTTRIYYRIASGGLVRACKVESERVGPPGYRDESDDE